MTPNWPIAYCDTFQLIPLGEIDSWLEVIDNGEDIQNICMSHYLPRESIIHAIATRYYDVGEPEKSIAILQKELAVNPDAKLHLQLIRSLVTHPKCNMEDVYKACAAWAASYADTSQAKKDSDFVERIDTEKITLGFICTYANTPPFVYGMLPLLKLLDRDKFKVVLINILSFPSQDIVKGCVDEFINISSTDADVIVNAIEERGIDILFDLNGHLRADNPITALLKRPSPVQISWWNSPCTSGVDTIHYYLSNASTTPKEIQKFYTEKVFCMKNSYEFTFDLPKASPIPGLPFNNAGIFTFASFNGLFKLNRDSLELWAEILAKVPNSRMVIKASGIASSYAQKKILAIFNEAGVEPARIIFDEGTPFDDMMAKYGVVDLGLGPFEYGSGTTLVNSLWQGVPYITLTGSTPQGLIADNILKDAGLGNFTASTKKEYVEKAVHYANNHDELIAFRQNARQILSNLPYFNPGIFVPEFERACAQIWERFKQVLIVKQLQEV